MGKFCLGKHIYTTEFNVNIRLYFSVLFSWYNCKYYILIQDNCSVETFHVFILYFVPFYSLLTRHACLMAVCYEKWLSLFKLNQIKFLIAWVVTECVLKATRQAADDILTKSATTWVGHLCFQLKSSTSHQTTNIVTASWFFKLLYHHK